MKADVKDLFWEEKLVRGLKNEVYLKKNRGFRLETAAFLDLTLPEHALDGVHSFQYIQLVF